MGMLTPTICKIKLLNRCEKFKVRFKNKDFEYKGIMYHFNPKKVYRTTWCFGLFSAYGMDFTEGISEPVDYWNRRKSLVVCMHKSDFFPDEISEEMSFDEEGYFLNEHGLRVPKLDADGNIEYELDDYGRPVLGGEFVESDETAMTPNQVGALLNKLAYRIKNFEQYVLILLVLVLFITGFQLYQMLKAGLIGT